MGNSMGGLIALSGAAARTGSLSKEKKEVTELVVAKHRNGRTGTLDLIFLPQFTQFADAVHKSISLD